MAKWHVNGKGVPAICKAEKGNCPFGNQDSHYTSKETAQNAADKIGENKHGLLSSISTDKIIEANATTSRNIPYSLSNFVNKGGNDYFTNIIKQNGMDSTKLIKTLNEDKNVNGKWSLKNESDDIIKLQNEDVFGNKQYLTVKSVSPPKPKVRKPGEYYAYNSNDIPEALSNFVSLKSGGSEESTNYFKGLIENAGGDSGNLVNVINKDKRIFGDNWIVKEESDEKFTLSTKDKLGNISSIDIYK